MPTKSNKPGARSGNTISPVVSILLPAYNAEATLNQALESISRQTLADFECIVINDNSKDDTATIAKAWTQRDQRFKVYHQSEHSGIVDALNRGLSLAQGQFVARQDADDISRPERLAKTIALIETDPDLAAVGCQVAMFPAEQVSPGFAAYGSWLNSLNTSEEIARDIWIESPLPHPTVVIRPEALSSCPGYRNSAWPEDYDLWLQMFTAGWKFAKVPEILYEWRHHSDRLTLCDARYSVEAFLDCKLHHLAQQLRSRTLLIWGAGRDGHRLGRALTARGHQIVAFIDIDPAKIGNTRQGVPVLSPDELLERYSRLTPAGIPELIPLVLVAVGVKGARALIRQNLTRIRRQAMVDYICLH